MPFGLTVAPSVYQNTMTEVLGNLIGDCVMVYIDDIIVHSKSYSDHLRHLALVFERLASAGLRLKPTNCHFLQKEILYLGHVITPKGLYPDPDKVKVIHQLQPPKTVCDVRAF